MNRRVLRLAAALVFAATVIGIIGILQNADQTAYAFEQTVKAMCGKSSFHLQTYYGSPSQRHDEFWAEFDECGKLVRLRQSDQWKRQGQPVELIWKNQIEYKYTPCNWGGILVIRESTHHIDQDRLVEFDPETIMEGIYRNVQTGEATIKMADSRAEDGHLVVEVTTVHQPYRWVMHVDPKTKRVIKWQQYQPSEEGDEEYERGIDVLEYNSPLDQSVFDPNSFDPDYPENTIVIDQVSGPVGLAQGELSTKETACEVARKTLEALARDDYVTAGLLFGGAPEKFFDPQCFALLKPVADIVVGEPRPHEWYGPTFMVPCSFAANCDGKLLTVNCTFWVRTGEGQHDRWFIDPTYLEYSAEE